MRVMVIYSNEHLHLASSWHADHLIVHLGDPGPTLNLGPYDLTYDEIELIGVGQFRMMRNGVTHRAYAQYASANVSTARTSTISGLPPPMHLPADAVHETIVIDDPDAPPAPSGRRS